MTLAPHACAAWQAWQVEDALLADTVTTLAGAVRAEMASARALLAAYETSEPRQVRAAVADYTTARDARQDAAARLERRAHAVTLSLAGEDLVAALGAARFTPPPVSSPVQRPVPKGPDQ